MSARRGPNFVDLTGQRFGRLVVVAEAGYKNNRTHWKCLCDCGQETEGHTRNLRRGHKQSCGCLVSETTTALNYKHGKTGTPLFRVWMHMIQRCYHVTHKSYPDYGQRGITVHQDWRDDFEAFEQYVSALPHCGEEGRSLDRINNDGNYEPGNIRWATGREQQNNRRSTTMLTLHGETKPLADWCRILDLRVGLVHNRLHRGWPVERALTEGVDPARLASVLAEHGGAA